MRLSTYLHRNHTYRPTPPSHLLPPVPREVVFDRNPGELENETARTQQQGGGTCGWCGAFYGLDLYSLRASMEAVVN